MPRLVTVSDNWLDAGDKRVKTEPPSYRDWWRAFNDPTLDRLIDTAYRENLPAGRGAGQDPVVQYRGDHPHPGNPASPDQERPLRLTGDAAEPAHRSAGRPGGIPAPPPQVAVGIPADLVRRRPDIRSAEAQAAAQCANIGVAKAELLPAFSLIGTFSFQSSDVVNFKLGHMFRWDSRNAQAGPSFQWNLLNYGRLTNQVRVQDARFQELIIGYQNAVLKAQQEVEDSLTGFLRSQVRAQMLGESTAAARRSFDLSVLQYREGTTDFTTVLTAQQALLNEQDSLAVTLGDISRNLVGVYRALGGAGNSGKAGILSRSRCGPRWRSALIGAGCWLRQSMPNLNPGRVRGRKGQRPRPPLSNKIEL